MSKKNDQPLNQEYMSEDGKLAFTLIRNFGIPPRIRAPGESKYPISEMRVGDAIKGGDWIVRSAAVAARTFSLRNPGTRFAQRKLKDGSHVLVRTA